MNRRPAFQFYPADWRKDPQLQMCNMATQGTWINIICCMWEAPEEGKLEGSWEDFSRLLGISVTDFKKFYIQANKHKFADVTNCNGFVTIINRRIYNAFLERERAKKGMRATRAKQQNENVTPHSSSSTSSSTSKNNIYSVQFENFWKLFKGRWDKNGGGDYGSYSKGSKAEAFKIWEKLTPNDQQKATSGAEGSAGKYTPDCYRWLREKRWER